MRSMSVIRILTLLGAAAAVLLLLKSSKRQQSPEHVPELSRWEGEGGPSAPDKHADRVVDQSTEYTADGTPIVHALA